MGANSRRLSVCVCVSEHITSTPSTPPPSPPPPPKRRSLAHRCVYVRTCRVNERCGGACANKFELRCCGGAAQCVIIVGGVWLRECARERDQQLSTHSHTLAYALKPAYGRPLEPRCYQREPINVHTHTCEWKYPRAHTGANANSFGMECGAQSLSPIERVRRTAQARRRTRVGMRRTHAGGANECARVFGVVFACAHGIPTHNGRASSSHPFKMLEPVRAGLCCGVRARLPNQSDQQNAKENQIQTNNNYAKFNNSMYSNCVSHFCVISSLNASGNTQLDRCIYFDFVFHVDDLDKNTDYAEFGRWDTIWMIWDFVFGM